MDTADPVTYLRSSLDLALRKGIGEHTVSAAEKSDEDNESCMYAEYDSGLLHREKDAGVGCYAEGFIGLSSAYNFTCHNAERCWCARQDSRTSAPYSNYQNLLLVFPPFLEVIAFGKDRKRQGVACHHPKLMILQRVDRIRVVTTVLSTRLERKLDDIIKLDANKNPYGPPPELIGTVVATYTSFAISWFLFTSMENICDPDKLPIGSPWTCAQSNIFYNTSIIWGVVGS